jgi:glycosyltransferase involved in cell wall biosynthesis
MASACFAAIVRTMGDRPQLLQQALESLTFQQDRCRAIVVVHGDSSAHQKVQQVCRRVGGLEHVALHAKDTGKRRGHPLNVGLDHCYDSESQPDFLFFLDDDDIVYPFFTRIMAAAFLTSQADVIYAASNRKEFGRPAAVGYTPKPIFLLLYENFITINSFAVRMETLRRQRCYFDEHFEYAEDWQFLVTLLQKGFRFEANFSTLSEFRIIRDGNREIKANPALWKQYSLQIRKQINRSDFVVPGAKLAGLACELEPRFGTQRETQEEVIAEQDRSIGCLRQRVYELEDSLSWRLTAPLRRVGAMLLKLGPRQRG